MNLFQDLPQTVSCVACWFRPDGEIIEIIKLTVLWPIRVTCGSRCATRLNRTVLRCLRAATTLEKTIRHFPNSQRLSFDYIGAALSRLPSCGGAHQVPGVFDSRRHNCIECVEEGRQEHAADLCCLWNGHIGPGAVLVYILARVIKRLSPKW